MGINKETMMMAGYKAMERQLIALLKKDLPLFEDWDGQETETEDELYSIN